MDSKHKHLSRADMADCQRHFREFDISGDGKVTAEEMGVILANIGEDLSPEGIAKLIAEVDKNKSGTIEYDEFLAVVDRVKEGHSSTQFQQVYMKHVALQKYGGAQEGTSHSFSEEERKAFSNYINHNLQGDEQLEGIVPLDPETDALFNAVGDGILLCYSSYAAQRSKLINHAQSGTIDDRALTPRFNAKFKRPINTFEVAENLNIMIESAKAIGCSIVNIGPEDMREGRPHLVLGLIWQIVKIALMSKITLKDHPEIFRLLESGEELSDLVKLPPEQILLRWVNYHLKAAGHERRMRNFTSDVKDSEIYTVLLAQIAPDQCDRSALTHQDMLKRADTVLTNAEKLGVKRFIHPTDIVKGNHKLNLAFVAELFNTWPALAPPEEEDKRSLADILGDEDDAEMNREEKAFRNWINNLGIETHVTSLFEELRDGIVMLQIMDVIQPGIVSWNKVNLKKPMNTWKKAENCNYALLLGKQLKCSLVGIGGTDFVDGHKKYTLALIWQLMRYHLLKYLKDMSATGVDVSERTLIKWANEMVAPKGLQVRDFNDKKIASGLYLLNLIAAVAPDAIDKGLPAVRAAGEPDRARLLQITPGETEEQKSLNARYAITAARKLGCTIFLIKEDVVDVKARMVLTFVAALMKYHSAKA